MEEVIETTAEEVPPTKPEEEAPTKETVKRAAIALNEKYLPAPKDNAELRGLIKTIALGGGFPAVFDTEEKRIAAYNLGRALTGDKWQLALNHMAFIEGKLGIYGEFPGALAEMTGEVQEKHVYVLDAEYKKICSENKNLDAAPFAGICIIQRKGREKKEFKFTLNDAKKIGKYPAVKRDGSPSPKSPWNIYTDIMLMRRAMQTAIKFEFPEAIMGVTLAEYDHGYAPDLDPEIKDVTPQEKAIALNAKFKTQRVVKEEAV